MINIHELMNTRAYDPIDTLLRVSSVNPNGEARPPSIPASAAVEAPSMSSLSISSEVFYEAILSKEYFRGEGLGLGQGQGQHESGADEQAYKALGEVSHCLFGDCEEGYGESAYWTA
ncbi:uncharacterized protein A4U43_C05F20630 [Asparagus officinalis]|uniref:Uncharacterized protein n=1 Tax=Asparagus officinalis TaxID=4686 RepID=A0A5P1ETU2_ASPOF|nr:uncharacterized protein A4U43_C05F20630 [Asparagus officinalis]